MYLAKALIVNDKKNGGFVRSPSAVLHFNFIVAAPKGLHSSVLARLFPPAAGELFTKTWFC